MIQIALYGLLALALMGAVGTGVYKVKQWGADEVRAEWAEEKATQREEEIQRSLNATAGLEVDRGKRRTIYKTITQYVDREVEKPVYGACLPPSGLCLANAALTGKGADSCKLDLGLSPAKSSFRWEWGIRTAKADRGG